MRSKEQQVPRCSEEEVLSMKYILNYRTVLVDLMALNDAVQRCCLWGKPWYLYNSVIGGCSNWLETSWVPGCLSLRFRTRRTGKGSLLH